MNNRIAIVFIPFIFMASAYGMQGTFKSGRAFYSALTSIALCEIISHGQITRSVYLTAN